MQMFACSCVQPAVDSIAATAAATWPAAPPAAPAPRQLGPAGREQRWGRRWRERGRRGAVSRRSGAGGGAGIVIDGWAAGIWAGAAATGPCSGCWRGRETPPFHAAHRLRCDHRRRHPRCVTSVGAILLTFIALPTALSLSFIAAQLQLLRCAVAPPIAIFADSRSQLHTDGTSIPR